MERDLLVMIYGAIMGVVGSIVTSLVTATFQLWLERREYERRQAQEHHRQLKQIHLPTDEEVRLINSDHQNEHGPETTRAAAEAGSILLSLILSSAEAHHHSSSKKNELDETQSCFRIIRPFRSIGSIIDRTHNI